MLLILFFAVCYAYDKNVAKVSVDLCQSAYCVTDKWDCLTCDSMADLDYIINIEDTKAIQGFDRNTQSIFTAFRGSSNIHNWIENIQVTRVAPYNDSTITVEKGFYKAYSYVKHEIFENIQTLSAKYDTTRLLLTGHSMGAAISTLMAYDVINEYPEYTISYLVNFGSPRVGNPAFAKRFNTYNIRNYRVTHYYDIVPHVPEEILGYRHVANEIWYNEENSRYTICNDENGEDNSCSNSCSPIHCTSTSDHLYYLNVTMGNDNGSNC